MDERWPIEHMSEIAPSERCARPHPRFSSPLTCSIATGIMRMVMLHSAFSVVFQSYRLALIGEPYMGVAA